MPRRIQRKRTKGWRMPRNALYVGRPTVFGNIFGGEPEEAVRAYREWVLSGLDKREARTGHFAGAVDAMAGYPRRNALITGLSRLRGHDLACWCALENHCHADFLLAIANR